MSKRTETIYFCDNARRCSSQETSGHGLPTGWFAVAYAVNPDGKKVHRHFCSAECVQQEIGEYLVWAGAE